MSKPTLEDFTRMLDASGLSDREASERMHLHPNYANRIRRGAVAWRPVYYVALKGVIAQLGKPNSPER